MMKRKIFRFTIGFVVKLSYKEQGGLPVKMKESYNLEFKEEISRTFLKTVSAYANYNDGEILFGIDDDGQLLGMKNLATEESLRIENMINDSLVPVPNFEISVEAIGDLKVIRLAVKKGKDTPYYCKGKAYKRADTATIEVDRFELRRLAMEGINLNDEDRKASSQELSFAVLERWLQEAAGIEKINLDILKTLNLYNKDGYYNLTGELLADHNEIGFSGIDMVKFGKDISQIQFRKTITNRSLLTQFDMAIELFEQYYIFEEIDGYNRTKKERIPKAAFRESLANAIVHRLWDINSFIQIAMYEDQIEINSPGGLPAGVSKEEYLYGNISVLRNPIIAGVFDRLNIIEKFGTGIARINEEYLHSMTKPLFDVSENRIRIVLPVIKIDKLDLPEDEGIVYGVLKEAGELTRKAIDLKTGFDKTKTIRVLNKLITRQLITKEGSGRSVTYKLK